MSTAPLLICSAWLRNVDVRPAALRRRSPGRPWAGRSLLTRRMLVPGAGRKRLKPAVWFLAAGLCLTGSIRGRAQEVASDVLDLPPAVVTAPASGPPTSPSRTIAGSGPSPCVRVDIAGHRAGHLECASRELEAAARVARRDSDAARNIPLPEAGSPDVQLGIASRAGTRLRLRGNFGKSVRPPAAPPPVFTPPGARRP